jgi:mRNA-degrading endonuclease RelE of RelBE toxin-antitoxin system
LKKIDRFEADRILKKIVLELSKQADELPELKDHFAGLRKYRIGKYRIIYAIIDSFGFGINFNHEGRSAKRKCWTKNCLSKCRTAIWGSDRTKNRLQKNALPNQIR